MKSKYFVSAALSGLFGLLVAFSASAQHRGGGGGGSHGGGGGGFHGGGGFSGGHSSGGGFRGNSGGGSFNRGGQSYQRSSSSNSNRGQSYQRPSGGNSSPRVNSQSFHGSIRSDIGNRGGSISAQRYSASHGYAGRGSVYAGRGGYRGSYNRGFYRGGGYYNRGVFYRGRSPFYGRYAYYSRYYLPRLGFSLSVLPYGYYPFYWGDYQYYYSGGYYYQYDNNNYTVVEPPVGAILGQLPSGAKSLMIDGEQYYELNGVYYQAVTKDDGTTGYQIAGKDGELNTGNTSQDNQGGNYDQNQDNQGPVNQSQTSQAPLKIGDIIDTLPADCSTVKIDGQKYYVSPDGIYYQEDKDNGHKVYRVAGTPDDQPGN